MRIEAKEAPAPSAELATISAVNAIVPSEFFKAGGSKAVLELLKEEVRKQAAQLDISTEAGRKAIASLAYKVARSKTALDEQGEKLGEELRRAKEAIDSERRAVRNELDALKDEVRKPLTDWENAEKARVVTHEQALRDLAACAEMPIMRQVIDVERMIARVDEIWKDREWEEFQKRAGDIRKATMFVLKGHLEAAERAEAERIQAEKLAAEARERAIREREEAAAKAAKEEAERKAQEQARIAREAAERERLRIETEKAEAEARAKQAEAQRIAAIEKAKCDAEAAEQRRLAAIREAEEAAERERLAALERERVARETAERNKLAAIEAERRRVAEEKRLEAKEAEKRAKNRAHLATVNRQILAALATVNISEEQGKLLIAAIVKGIIPHVKIEY